MAEPGCLLLVKTLTLGTVNSFESDIVTDAVGRMEHGRATSWPGSADWQCQLGHMALSSPGFSFITYTKGVLNETMSIFL